MSITDELRKWGRDTLADTSLLVRMEAIADRIDAEHERQLEVLYRDMSDVEWVRLPVDADGEPINIGDVMENIVCPPVHREVMGVGVECFYGWDDGNGRYSQFDANCYRHHHATTVEDVLREIVHKCQPTYSKDGSYTTGLTEEEFAEYAAKLQLRGGVE